MAKLYITEFSGGLKHVGSTGGDVAQIESMATGIDQTPVVIGVGSLQSAAFAATTTYIWISTDAICSIAYGANPTATANSRRFPADYTGYFGVNPSDKIAVITNT